MATSALVEAPVTRTRSQMGDTVAHLIVMAFAAIILVITALLVLQLWTDSALTRHKFGFGFLVSKLWNPVTDEFGALPFVYGTVVTSILALLMSVPLGLGAAIFLSELAPARVSSGLTFLIELLAAIPSVIYGMLALFTLVPLMRRYGEPFLKSTLGFLPLFQGRGYGVGFLTAGIVLSLMIVPYIISVSREALMAVPREQREAALALGATGWETTWQIVVPYARLGIFGSIFLSLARALGETMAVTMVIGNDPRVSASILAAGHSIAAVIAGEFSEATGPIYQSALVELGLVLFVLTIMINAVARLMILATTRKGSKR
jgi:phosphate transport system permease protein